MQSAPKTTGTSTSAYAKEFSVDACMQDKT